MDMSKLGPPDWLTSGAPRSDQESWAYTRRCEIFQLAANLYNGRVYETVKLGTSMDNEVDPEVVQWAVASALAIRDAVEKKCPRPI